jgi:hypothetical protein
VCACLCADDTYNEDVHTEAWVVATSKGPPKSLREFALMIETIVTRKLHMRAGQHGAGQGRRGKAKASAVDALDADQLVACDHLRCVPARDVVMPVVLISACAVCVCVCARACSYPKFIHLTFLLLYRVPDVTPELVTDALGCAMLRVCFVELAIDHDRQKRAKKRSKAKAKQVPGSLPAVELIKVCRGV